MTIFDQAVERLDRFIWFLSNRYAQGLQSMEAADLHQIGLMKVNDICSNPNYMFLPDRELDWTIKRSLHNLYIDTVHKGADHRELVVYIDLQALSVAEESFSYDAFEEVYVKHYQEHLAKIVSSDASALLEHMLNPTPAVYHMFNIMCMRRRALQGQGMKARIPTKLTQEIVGKTLGFSVNYTKCLIRELRQAWRTECQSNWRQSEVMS